MKVGDQPNHEAFPPAGLAEVVAMPKPDASTPEPPPAPNDQPAVWLLVIADMQDRDRFGRAKYGTPLQPFNGRDALNDAYQEALDLAVYLRQRIEEDRQKR